MMKITEEKINSNITLNYIPMTKLKTTSLGIYIHRDLNAEQSSKNALLPFVLKRGCRLCPNSEDMSKYLENLYGAKMAVSVLKHGNEQIMALRMETISDKFTPDKEPLLADMTKLALSVIFEPAVEKGGFLSEYVEQEKKNAVERIKSVINDKRMYATIRCIEEMCKDDVYALSSRGTEEGINAQTPEGLYEYYKSIIESSKIEIYICGDCSVKAVKKEICEYIKGIDFKEPKKTVTEILTKDTNDVNRIEEEMDVTQGKLSIGFRTNIKPQDDDIIPLAVLNSIFGAGAHSKLFNNVREKLSLAYYASSGLDKQKGLLTVNAGIEFKNFQKAYDESLAQLEEIKKGNISELEFVSSINALISAYMSAYDDPAALQGFMLAAEADGTEKNIDEIIKKIKKVTVEDVVRVSENIELDTVYFLKGKESIK